MKINFQRYFNDVKKVLTKYSPEILTGIGVAGMITTTILAVKATPEALDLIEEKKEKLEVEELTKVETIKTAWKPYVPAVITGVTSIACITGASAKNYKRNAALATAYKISEEALSTYKEKVIETIGEKKEKVISEKVDKEKLEKNPVSKNEVIITGRGAVLCYDILSDRYFESDMDTIQKAINRLNRDINYENYVSLSQFYDELGLKHTGVSDYLGWNLDMGLIDARFDSQIADDGRPCLVLDYGLRPQANFDNLRR